MTYGPIVVIKWSFLGLAPLQVSKMDVKMAIIV
jgi:hypothetical protein